MKILSAICGTFANQGVVQSSERSVSRVELVYYFNLRVSRMLTLPFQSHKKCSEYGNLVTLKILRATCLTFANQGVVQSSEGSVSDVELPITSTFEFEVC